MGLVVGRGVHTCLHICIKMKPFLKNFEALSFAFKAHVSQHMAHNTLTHSISLAMLTPLSPHMQEASNQPLATYFLIFSFQHCQ